MDITYSAIYADMAKQTHLLIAGKTGSGKSVVVNGIIHRLLQFNENQVQFVLIDPKKVELYKYARLPQTMIYADEEETMRSALQRTVRVMEDRFRTMRNLGQVMYTGSDIYVFIDECADLMTTDAKNCKPLLQRIAQLGRAAKVHLILCTQRPTNNIIPIDITCNIDSRVALKCAKAQDSRNIIGVSGAENLPKYGECFYMTPDIDGIDHYRVPMTNPDDTQKLIDYWCGTTTYKPNQTRQSTGSSCYSYKKSDSNSFWRTSVR